MDTSGQGRDDDGQIVALDAKTGRHLWHYSMGQLLTASPVTFQVNGKQYITLLGASFWISEVIAATVMTDQIPV